MNDEMKERLILVRQQSRRATARLIILTITAAVLLAAAVLAWIDIIKAWQIVRAING